MIDQEKYELTRSLMGAILVNSGALEQIRAIEDVLKVRVAFVVQPPEPESGIILPEQNIENPSSLLS